uniref:Reverse transcriptase domain-containing protein n=1 Tax=Heterorhabditis bacteriophora TaxID=37862 RepID=A0A1I7XUD3_HETBA
MWRENVPSIENVDRLLRRGHTTDNRGRSTKHRNVRSGASREFNNDQTSGTSLRALNAAHDRMLIRTSDTKRFNRGRKKGEQGGQSKGKESVNLKNKQLGNTGYTESRADDAANYRVEQTTAANYRVEQTTAANYRVEQTTVNSTGHHHKTIERQTFKGNGGNGGKDNTTIRGHINEVSKRNRRGDKYIIGTMLRKLVDRVVRMEKQEKKFQQRQTNNKDILKMESADVHPSKDVGKIASTLGSEAENLKDTQILKISNTKTNRDKEILMELSKSLLKEEKTEEEFMNNSEHNVIKLVEEKVLSMHLSPV